MTLHCRTAFISDVHLGTRGCQADLLLEFIKTLDCETLYLVGDIVDGWKLKSGWRWPQAHSDVVQKVLRMARKGVKVIYVPGNHDDRVRDFCGIHFGGVEVVRETIHVAADGKRYLVTHGDEFDGIVTHARWLAYLGDYAYRALIALNTRWNALRRRLGLGYWSLSAYLKLKVKNAVQFIDDYETALTEEARRRGVDGVICGHIHHAEIRQIGGLIYINDGDWVESCTAVVEDHNGVFSIVEWAKAREAWIDRQSPSRSKPLPGGPVLEPASA